MSSEKRKAQRRYVKNQLLKEKGNTDGFKEAWEDYRRKEKKNEDGSLTEVKQTGNVVESGTVNNFIKLDHKKVVNSTLALLDDSVVKRAGRSIHDTSRYKILMFFIEPNYDTNYKKSFNMLNFCCITKFNVL